MGIRGIHRERDGSIRARMNKLWNGGEKFLGSAEGRVQHRRPGKGERPCEGLEFKLHPRETVGGEEMSEKFNLRDH